MSGLDFTTDAAKIAQEIVANPEMYAVTRQGDPSVDGYPYLRAVAIEVFLRTEMLKSE